jgi:ribosome biogenesis SPOUT family RNA methylase Rps3
MIHHVLTNDADFSDRTFDDESMEVLFDNVNLLREFLDNEEEECSHPTTFLMVNEEEDHEPVPLREEMSIDDEEMSIFSASSSSESSEHSYYSDDQELGSSLEDATNIEISNDRPASPLTCGSPVYEEEPQERAISRTVSMSSSQAGVRNDKLSECMERSALSRSLVENFCQVSMKKGVVVTVKNKQSKEERQKKTKTKQPTVRRKSVLSKHSVYKNKEVILDCSTREKRSEERIEKQFPQQKSPTGYQKAKKNEKKSSFDFRLSGLKVSEEKMKRLDAKLKLLDSMEKKPSSVEEEEEDDALVVSSFLRRQKSNGSILEQAARSAHKALQV